MNSLYVHLLPSLFQPEDLQGDTVVVIDILRATTSMTHALANGAKKIIPCLTVEEAFAAKEEHQPNVLLGGERGGVKIDGFDLSNSPDDYVAKYAANQTIVFTTTNGTKALLKSEQADEIYLGCFANLSYVADLCRQANRNIHLVCAGTNGEVSNEDVLFAGAVANKLADTARPANDSASLAGILWEHAMSRRENGVHQCICDSYGGANLQKLGFDRDIVTAAEIDTLPIVGRFDGTCIQAVDGVSA